MQVSQGRMQGADAGTSNGHVKWQLGADTATLAANTANPFGRRQH